jgi:hypothetical protein
MLPEPKGTFETVGEKICYELVHFQFARSAEGSFALTDDGRNVLGLLDTRKYTELRRIMVTAHLQTYDNLRAVVQRHLEVGHILRPIADAAQLSSQEYVRKLLEPTFEERATDVAMAVWGTVKGRSPKKAEDLLQELVLREIFPAESLSVPLFRAMCDRLVSLRLLNIMKANINDCEFDQSYSPCFAASPPQSWYVRLNVPLRSKAEVYAIFIPEPNMAAKDTQERLLASLDEAFAALNPLAGYFDLPDVRDFVCNQLRIPEAAFDEGINCLLDLRPCSLTAGLHYEGISGRRKPLIRTRETTQIYNLIRRT